MTIKAILFDLDNTLINFTKMKSLCIEAAVDAMLDAGLLMKKETAIDKLYKIYDKHGMEYQKIFDDFLRQNFGKVDYKILGSGISAYRKIKLAYLEPYPHVMSTLIQLAKKGYTLCIVSDAPRLQAWTRLASLKLNHLFDVVVTYEDTKTHKDTGPPFKAALKKLKLKPEECLMVGDYVIRDITGAKKLGIKTAFAKYGDFYNVKKSGANWELNDISDILKIVN